MRYGIAFLPSAQDEVTTLFDGPRDTERLNEAMLRVLADLRYNAHDVGESRADAMRVCTVGPLTFHFEADQVDAQVTVTRVVRHEPPPLKPRQ